MKYSEAFPSRYLKADDLGDQDWSITIKKVSMETIGQGGDAQQKLILFFEEMEKGLVLNKTNAGVIAKLYGDDTDDWLGKQVTIWPNHDVEFKGEIVSAIRVRNRKPNGNTSAGARAGNGVLTFEAALREAAAVGLQADDLKARLHELGINAYNAAKHTPVVREIISQAQSASASEDDIPF